MDAATQTALIQFSSSPFFSLQIDAAIMIVFVIGACSSSSLLSISKENEAISSGPVLLRQLGSDFRHIWMHSLLISPAISFTRSFLIGLHLHIDLAICDNVPLQSIFPIEARPPSSDFCFVFEGHWTVIVTLVLPPSAVALQLLLGPDTAPAFSGTRTFVAFLACYFSLQMTPRLSLRDTFPQKLSYAH